MLKSTPKCHKLTLEVLKVTFSGSKCQRTWFGPTIKWKKSRLHRRKKPKIDLWEITGCAQIQEIERPVTPKKTRDREEVKLLKLGPQKQLDFQKPTRERIKNVSIFCNLFTPFSLSRHYSPLVKSSAKPDQKVWQNRPSINYRRRCIRKPRWAVKTMSVQCAWESMRMAITSGYCRAFITSMSSVSTSG
jgi:hypothetical protein